MNRKLRKSLEEQRTARQMAVVGMQFICAAFPVLLLLVFAFALAYPEAFQSASGTGVTQMGVDTTTFLEDAKIIYGALQNQIGQQAVLINLMGDGSKFAKPISEIGIKGYTFLARLARNWNMGYRKEGISGVGAAGNQGLKQATISLKYAYVPVLITGQAENLTKGNTRAFMQAKALEAKFDMQDIVEHVDTVIAGGNRGGVLAVVAAAGIGAGAFTGETATNLPGALFLRKGMPIDAGPAGGGVLTINNSKIATINYATAAVTHAAGTANAADVVYLAGEAPVDPADFPLTSEGLHSLIDDSTAIQGLDPGTAGQESWMSYIEDMGAATISPQSLMRLKQFVKNWGGVDPNMYLVGPAQVNQYAGIATATLRYDVVGNGPGKKALDLGFTTFSFGNTPMIEDKYVRNDRVYCGSGEHIHKFEAVPLSMAEDEAGTWTRISGTNGIADAVQGLLRWYHQIGTTQRSAWGVQKNYAVPTAFAQKPQGVA